MVSAGNQLNILFITEQIWDALFLPQWELHVLDGPLLPSPLILATLVLLIGLVHIASLNRLSLLLLWILCHWWLTQDRSDLLNRALSFLCLLGRFD